LAKPRLDELATWLDAQLQRIPGKSDLAGAIRYASSRWPALTAYVDRGQLEISKNAAKNAIRPVALGRNYAQVRIMRSCRDGGHESTQLSLWEASSLRSATAHN
jgi:hypothetical protein